MKILLNLKKYISLNLISLLGHLGVIVLIYFVFINPVITHFFIKFPYITLNGACAYFAISVLLFFVLVIAFLIEFFIFKTDKFQNKKPAYLKYSSIIPMWFFVTGLIIAVSAVLFYFYMWWVITS